MTGILGGPNSNHYTRSHGPGRPAVELTCSMCQATSIEYTDSRPARKARETETGSWVCHRHANPPTTTQPEEK